MSHTYTSAGTKGSWENLADRCAVIKYALQFLVLCFILKGYELLGMELSKFLSFGKTSAHNCSSISLALFTFFWLF